MCFLDCVRVHFSFHPHISNLVNPKDDEISLTIFSRAEYNHEEILFEGINHIVSPLWWSIPRRCDGLDSRQSGLSLGMDKQEPRCKVDGVCNGHVSPLEDYCVTREEQRLNI